MGSMPRKPPLEVVRGVRSRAVDEAAAVAREAAAKATGARDVAERAKEHERSVRASASARTLAEQDALAPGASPRALAQLAAFEHGLETKIAREAAKAREAERRAAEASLEEDVRRQGLVTAKGALDVVEKHQARTRAQQDKHDQEKLDETAEESHAARRRPLR